VVRMSVTWADRSRAGDAEVARGDDENGRSRVVASTDLVAELWPARRASARAAAARQSTDRVPEPRGADWKRETNSPRRLLDRILDRAGIASGPPTA
jgi:hypothetical protein